MPSGDWRARLREVLGIPAGSGTWSCASEPLDLLKMPRKAGREEAVEEGGGGGGSGGGERHDVGGGITTGWVAIAKDVVRNGGGQEAELRVLEVLEGAQGTGLEGLGDVSLAET